MSWQHILMVLWVCDACNAEHLSEDEDPPTGWEVDTLGDVLLCALCTMSAKPTVNQPVRTTSCLS